MNFWSIEPPASSSCRIWLPSSFPPPTANVTSMQLDRGRGNGVTLLQVSGWAASGRAEELDWVQSPSGAATEPPREHAKATDFFFPFLSFCVPHQAAELESLSVRFTFTATLMRRGHTVICSSRRRQTFETQILLHVAHSLISFLQRDATPLMRNATFFWGGGGLQ